MHRIDHAVLRECIADILAAMGSDKAEAAVVSDQLVDANLAGHDSHGVGLIPRYVQDWSNGALVPNETGAVIKDTGPILTIDARLGYGQRIGREATETIIGRAREHGMAFLGLANAHHVGRVGSYGLQCAEAGLVATIHVNVIGDYSTLVAPHGGSDARFATNPYCCALPAAGDRPPMVVDMATSKIAVGKVRVALNKGEEVEDDTLIDRNGRPTRDPGVMFPDRHGALLPFGGHKGYALAMACEMMAGALTGGGTAQYNKHGNAAIVNNMSMIVLDPAQLVDPAFFAEEVEKMQDYVCESPPADPDKPVLVPGDPERRAEAERRKNGIPIDPRTIGEIIEAGAEAGADRDALTRRLRG